MTEESPNEPWVGCGLAAALKDGTNFGDVPFATVIISTEASAR